MAAEQGERASQVVVGVKGLLHSRLLCRGVHGKQGLEPVLGSGLGGFAGGPGRTHKHKFLCARLGHMRTYTITHTHAHTHTHTRAFTHTQAEAQLAAANSQLEGAQAKLSAAAQQAEALRDAAAAYEAATRCKERAAAAHVSELLADVARAEQEVSEGRIWFLQASWASACVCVCVCV